MGSETQNRFLKAVLLTFAALGPFTILTVLMLRSLQQFLRDFGGGDLPPQTNPFMGFNAWLASNALWFIPLLWLGFTSLLYRLIGGKSMKAAYLTTCLALFLTVSFGLLPV